jgi:hypothetical protein
MVVETKLLQTLAKIPRDFFRFLLILFFFTVGSCRTIAEREYPKDHLLGNFLLLPTVDNEIDFFSFHRLKSLLYFRPTIKIYTAPIIEVNVKSSKDPTKKFGKLTFLIDIGSNINLIDSRKIQIKGNKNSIPTYGINGKSMMDLEEVYLNMDLSSSYSSDYVRFYKTELPKGLPVDGILGNEFLNRYNVYMEYPDKFQLFRKEKVSSGLKKNFIKLKPLYGIQSHWVVELEIKEKVKNFIFDTGASYSTLNRAENYELDLKQEGELRIVDFAGMDKKSPIFILPNYCILSNPKICDENLQLFGDFDISNFFQNKDVSVSGLLGMNFIKKYNVFLDNSSHTIYLQPKK